MPKLVKMASSMVEDSGICYQLGDHVMIEDEAEADRWIEKGAATEADEGAKPKHSYPPKRRKAAATDTEGGSDDGKKSKKNPKS